MMAKRFCIGAYVGVAIVALLAGSACTSPRLSADENKLYSEMRSDLTPQWSSDGETIVGYADYHLYGASADGHELWRITKRKSLAQTASAISTDNRLAYFSANPPFWRSWFTADAGQRHLIISDLDGQRTRVQYTVPVPWVGHSPAWSPDGSLLGYSQGGYTQVADRTGTELYRFTVPSPDEWQQTKPYISSKGMAWSNDSRHIAISVGSSDGGGQAIVYVAKPDGSDQRIIASINIRNVHEMSSPAWSHDDQRIYFAARKHSEQDAVLYSVTRDGTEQQAVATLHGGNYVEIKMSPNGVRLLLISRKAGLPGGVVVPPREEGTGMYVINVDGSDLRQIRRGYLYASWSPDGDRIAVVDLDTTSQRGSIFYTMHTNGAPGRLLMRRADRGKPSSGDGVIGP